MFINLFQYSHILKLKSWLQNCCNCLHILYIITTVICLTLDCCMESCTHTHTHAHKDNQTRELLNSHYLPFWKCIAGSKHSEALGILTQSMNILLILQYWLVDFDAFWGVNPVQFFISVMHQPLPYAGLVKSSIFFMPSSFQFWILEEYWITVKSTLSISLPFHWGHCTWYRAHRVLLDSLLGGPPHGSVLRTADDSPPEVVAVLASSWLQV